MKRHLSPVLTTQAQSLEATWQKKGTSFHKLSRDTYTIAVVCGHMDVHTQQNRFHPDTQ